MSLTNTVKNRLIDALHVAFDAIGISEPKMPRLKKGDNKAAIAWEYYVADDLESRANARLKEAKRRAMIAGVIFDPEKEPREPGVNEPVYVGEQVAVWVEVRRGSKKVNADLMSEYLIKKGVDAKLVADAYASALSMTRPAHVFRVSLVGQVEGK